VKGAGRVRRCNRAPAHFTLEERRKVTHPVYAHTVRGVPPKPTAAPGATPRTLGCDG
jgi:hypothetical protein